MGRTFTDFSQLSKGMFRKSDPVVEVLSRAEAQRRGGGVLENAFGLDMLVDDTVIVELKSTENMSPVFAKQLKTYLAITKLQVGVVVNFGMSTLKEGFLRFVNNFTEPQLRASAPLREDNPTATSIANMCF